MKKLCLNFQVHQPFRLKRYRFFDIGNDHYYFDDFQNEEIFRSHARESYGPANRMLLELIKETKGALKVSFAISGTALSQMEYYAPELLDSFSDLAKTGCVEFLTEPFSHGLSSLGDFSEFKRQVELHAQKIEMLFGQKPKVLRNTELIYSDEIAEQIHRLGYNYTITEGAKHILGWKSPNFVYASATTPAVHLLLRNGRFSEDIMKNFSRYDWSEYPLTADKYAHWLANTPPEEEVIYLDMAYDVLGQIQPAHTGIFEFFKALPKYILQEGMAFATPTEVFESLSPKGEISVSSPISWSEEEKNISTWKGNVLQQEAFSKLVQWGERTRLSGNRQLLQDWLYLQSSDHFFYMSTTNAHVRSFSPYDNEYDAFNNYMNILSDFHLRVEAQYPSTIENEELNALLVTIHNQEAELAKLRAELDAQQKNNPQPSSKKEKTNGINPKK